MIKKVIAGLVAGLFFMTSLAFAISEDSIDSTCKVCADKTCTVYRLPSELIYPFLYAVWIKVNEVGVKEWNFKCSTKEKKISGQFHLEEITEK